MGRRVTIAGSMGLVALAAIGIASLRSATPLSASLLFSLTLASLFGAMVVALCRPGRVRAIWGSFALCGGGFLWMSLVAPSSGSTAPRLISDALIDATYWRPAEQNRGVLLIGSGSTTFGGSYQVAYSSAGYWLGHPGSAEFSPTFLPRPLYQTAQTLFALAAATAGAVLAHGLTRPPPGDARRSEPADGPSQPPPFDDHP